MARAPRPWPPWAEVVAMQARPGEAGLVETLERVVGSFGSEQFKVWYAEVFGVFKPCPCARLRARWSVLYAY